MDREPFARHTNELLLLTSWMEQDDDLLAGFTTRKGGKSSSPYSSLNLGLHVGDEPHTVIENRQQLAGALSFPISQWVIGEQIHSNAIEKVTKKQAGAGSLTMSTAIKGVDGLYTEEEGILLTSVYADCVPLYFYAPAHKMIGVAHAGWKGTVSQIGSKMIEIWNQKEKIPLSDIFIAVGPSISKESYEVDERVIKEVKKCISSEHFEHVFQATRNGHYSLDLKELNVLLLLEQGIKREQVMKSSYCTAKQLDLFYSHRAENGKTGRMMSFIGLKE